MKATSQNTKPWHQHANTKPWQDPTAFRRGIIQERVDEAERKLVCGLVEQRHRADDSMVCSPGPLNPNTWNRKYTINDEFIDEILSDSSRWYEGKMAI